MSSFDQKLSDEQFRSFLVGQILCFVGMGTLDFETARAGMRSFVADDDLWRKLPHLIANMNRALPTIRTSVEVDSAMDDYQEREARRHGWKG